MDDVMANSAAHLNAYGMTPSQAAECQAVADAMEHLKTLPNGTPFIIDLLMGCAEAAGLTVVDKKAHEAMRSVLDRIRCARINTGKCWIGVVTDDSCWAVEIDEEGWPIFEAWAKERAAALGGA